MFFIYSAGRAIEWNPTAVLPYPADTYPQILHDTIYAYDSYSSRFFYEILPLALTAILILIEIFFYCKNRYISDKEDQGDKSFIEHLSDSQRQQWI